MRLDVSKLNALKGNTTKAEQTKQDDRRQINAYFRAAYNLLDAYTPPKDDPKYWKDVTDDIALIKDKYNDNPLICDLLRAVLAELQRQLNVITGQTST